MELTVEPVKPGAGPAHSQIESSLTQAVSSGRLAPGDRLPPERVLAARLGVSRMTLRHALDSLERRGLVARRVGREGGTFVSEPKLELAGLAGLSDQLRALGLAAGARVLSARERAADGATAVALELDRGAPVYEIARVRLADGEPVALERTTFPAAAFPGLLEEALEGSLYELLRARGDELPVRAVERLEPVLAGAEAAAALGVAVGEPLLRVERTTYARSGRPLELGADLFRGDRTRVVWESELRLHS
jgi:DNA-binding GntR family transcriptional regulator